ncbi:MAG: TonB-dependent receptor [Elusimicrobia bacterium]|nr:TonB-dependent receptor [Elusimicrobiota bacterium]
MYKRFICALLLAYGAAAGAAASDDGAELEEVVVTASKTPLSKKRATQSVQVITSEEISRQQVTEVHELLRDVAGLSVTQTGSRGGTVSIFSRGGSANHNLVLIDGVRVNRSGGTFDFADLSLANIERIEVVRGAASALYGSDAIGSVIHIITKKGRGAPRVDVSVAGGSYRTFEEKLSLSAGAGDNGGYSIGVSKVDSKGFLPINNGYNSLGLSGSLQQKLYDKLDLSLTGNYSDGEFKFPTELAGDRLQAALDPRQFRRTKRTTIGADLTLPVHEAWTHRLQLGVNQEHRFQKDPRDPGVDTTDLQIQTLEGRRSVDYSWNVRLPEFASIRSEMIAGIAWERETLEETRRNISAANVTTAQATDIGRENHAYYLQTQLNWKDAAFLTPGVRFEDNQTFGRATIPRLSGGVFVAKTGTKVRGSWAKGITEPSFFQTFGGGTTVGNPDLRPERVETWEAGLDQYLLDNAVELNATYFSNQYTDLIARVAPMNVNIQSAESAGFETTVRGRLKWPQELVTTLSLSHTYLETKALADGGVGGTSFPPGQQLLRRPKHRGAVTLDVAGKRFSVNANATLQGRSLDQDWSLGVNNPRRVSLPGYVKTDLTATAIVYSGRPEVRLFARAENLFDRRYEEAFGFSTPGFRLLAGTAVRF